MARKAKAQTIAEDVAKAGMTPEDRFNKHYPQIRAAFDELGRARDEMKSANGTYRGLLRAFKKDGGNVEMLCEALRLQKRDVQEVDRDFRDLNAYLRLIGLPVGTQLGLDLNGKTIATAIEDEKIGGAVGDDFDKPHLTNEAMIAAAKTKGFDAGASGKNGTDNPYDEGSPEALAWAAEWQRAQEGMARRLGRAGRNGGTEHRAGA